MREITIGYGQTEASPIITLTSVDDPIEVRVGTVGRPIPGVEVRVVDPLTRKPVARGEAGELCTRGHNVMAGYYKNPEATARVIDADGWLYTGDLARERDDGNYRIVGRCKELIIRGGENIYPPEIEEFLTHHPACPRRPSSDCPTPGTARRSRPGSSPGPARRCRPTTSATTAGARSPISRCRTTSRSSINSRARSRARSASTSSASRGSASSGSKGDAVPTA